MDLKQIKETAIAMLWLPIGENEFSPMIVDHPFLESGMVPYQGELRNVFEDDDAMQDVLKNYLEMIQDAKDLETIFLLLRKPYYFVFLKFIEDNLTRQEFSYFLGYVWTESENPNQDVNVSVEEATEMFKRSEKEFLMLPEELIMYKRLPNELEVYRGVATGRNPDGLSWTNSLSTAKWFSQRWQQGGYIRKGIVKKEKILSYFNRRDENELVISPKDILNPEIL